MVESGSFLYALRRDVILDRRRMVLEFTVLFAFLYALRRDVILDRWHLVWPCRSREGFYTPFGVT